MLGGITLSTRIKVPLVEGITKNNRTIPRFFRLYTCTVAQLGRT